MKFTEHGEIKLRVTSERTVGEQIGLAFSLRDTGIGLTSEHRSGCSSRSHKPMIPHRTYTAAPGIQANGHAERLAAELG